MKQIESISVWYNGASYQAVSISVNCTYDDYESKAINAWRLLDVDMNVVSSGYDEISGQDYINWGNQPADSVNDWIYNWVAGQLNLTII
jgi:hypothetical protein